jgi:hypothetical protein
LCGRQNFNLNLKFQIINEIYDHDMKLYPTIDWHQLLQIVHFQFFSGSLAHYIGHGLPTHRSRNRISKSTKTSKKDVIFLFIYQGIWNKTTIFQLTLKLQVKLEILSPTWIFKLGLKFQIINEIYNTIFWKFRYLQRTLSITSSFCNRLQLKLHKC